MLSFKYLIFKHTIVQSIVCIFPWASFPTTTLSKMIRTYIFEIDLKQNLTSLSN
jgi:hypothetical protein